MHPPSWICKELERIHPQLRLGWVGRDRSGPADELNKGSFALIQLYHQRDASRTFFTPWNATGPVFGTDYDRLARVPVYLADIEPQDVFSGACIPLIRRWMRPLKERVVEAQVAKGREYESSNQDLAEAQTDYMLWHASKSDMSDRTVTNSDLTAHDKAVLDGATKQDLTEAFVNKGSGMALT